MRSRNWLFLGVLLALCLGAVPLVAQEVPGIVVPPSGGWQDWLVANQLWLATVLTTLGTSALIRWVTWFSALQDRGRIAVALAIGVGVTGLVRALGGAPAPELLASLPDLVAALLAALGIGLPGAASASALVRVARTQPGSY